MKTDVHQQVQNSFLYLVPVLIGNFLPMVTLPIFTRILTKEDYGVFALSQIYAVFMSGLANFGLILGYERNFFQYKDQEKSAQLLYSTLSMVMMAFAGFTVMTYVCRFDLAKWIIGSSQHGDLLFWTFCSSTVLSFKNYFLTYFKNTENARAVVWYTVDENVLGVVLSLLLIVYLRSGVIGLALGPLVSSVVILTVLMVRFAKILPFAWDWGVLKECLKISYPLTPRIFFGVISNQFDKYMLGLLTSVGGVGIYSIGQRLAYISFTYMNAIQNVFSPQVYKRMFELGEEGGRSVGRYLTPFCYVSIAAALVVALFAEEVVRVLTPASYHGAIGVVIVLSMLYGSYFFGKQPQLVYAKKTGLTSLLTLLAIGLNVGFNIPGIMWWGVMGAAWSTMCAGLVSGGISFIVSQRYYNIRWEYRKIGLILVVFFGSCLTTLLLLDYAHAYSVRLAAKLACLAIYLGIGMQFGIVTRASVAIMKKSLFLRFGSQRKASVHACDHH